jgi:hypothetical protein
MATYTLLKSIKPADVLKAADRIANLAMNLAFRSVSSRDCSVLAELKTAELRTMPAGIRKFFAVGKVKDEDRYRFSESKYKSIREKLDLPSEGVLDFDAFVAAVQVQLDMEVEKEEPTDLELKIKATKACVAAFRAAFRAGFTKSEVAAMLAKAEIEARETPSEAPVVAAAA